MQVCGMLIGMFVHAAHARQHQPDCMFELQLLLSHQAHDVHMIPQQTCFHRRSSSAVDINFNGPAVPNGIDLSGNIFSMLGRLNLSSVHSNAQRLVTPLSRQDIRSVADALGNQPTSVFYDQHGNGLAVSIGSSTNSLQRAVQLRGQAYISHGWAASHLSLSSSQHQQSCASAASLPLLGRVCCLNTFPMLHARAALCSCHQAGSWPVIRCKSSYVSLA